MMNRQQRRKYAKGLNIRNKQIRKEKKMIQDLTESLKQRLFTTIEQMK